MTNCELCQCKIESYEDTEVYEITNSLVHSDCMEEENEYLGELNEELNKEDMGGYG